MCCISENNNQIEIQKGIYFDNPKFFLAWDTDENSFNNMFKNHHVSKVVEKYYGINDVTVFLEPHCNIGVKFDKAIHEIGIARDKAYFSKKKKYDEMVKISFCEFQVALKKAFGAPTTAQKRDGLEEFWWLFENGVRIHHYLMNRFGLAEYLYIENLRNK